jgi:hypothetical protein
VVGGLFVVQAGYPISFGPNLNGALRSSAVFIDKVLKGVKPSDLPIGECMWIDLAKVIPRGDARTPMPAGLGAGK